MKQKVRIQLFIPHGPTASSRQGAVREEAVYLVDRICGSQAVDPERSWIQPSGEVCYVLGNNLGSNISPYRFRHLKKSMIFQTSLFAGIWMRSLKGRPSICCLETVVICQKKAWCLSAFNFFLRNVSLYCKVNERFCCL